jgi:hypothetical protein
MPNIWAHIQFGREVLNQLDADVPMSDDAWRRAFQLGCQGPDFMFYHHFLPWQRQTPLNRLGSQMHSVRCGPFLMSLFGRAREREVSEPATAFSIGFLLHHILDRHLHPFVFSRSGFKKWHHQRFETAMDSVVLHRRAGIHTGITPVAPEIDTGGKLPGHFSADFLRIVTLHYPVLAKQITPDEIDEAVAQMITAQKLFFDPSGWKGKLLLRHIEPFSPPRRLPVWDVLNDTRQPWIDPCDRTLVRNESAMDLWEHALEDGKRTAAAGIAWLQAEPGDTVHEWEIRFAELLKDVSYETGRPCGSASIIYAESVVPAAN